MVGAIKSSMAVKLLQADRARYLGDYWIMNASCYYSIDYDVVVHCFPGGKRHCLCGTTVIESPTSKYKTGIFHRRDKDKDEESTFDKAVEERIFD